MRESLFAYLRILYPDPPQESREYGIVATQRNESARHLAALVLLFPIPVSLALSLIFTLADMPKNGMGMFVIALGFIASAWLGRSHRQYAIRTTLLWATLAVFVMSHFVSDGTFSYPYYLVIQIGAFAVFGVKNVRQIAFFVLLTLIMHSIAVYITFPLYSFTLMEHSRLSSETLVIVRFSTVLLALFMLLLLQQKSYVETEKIIDTHTYQILQQEQRLNDIVCAVHEAIWLTDASGELILSNPALLDALQKRFGTILNNRFRLVDLMTPTEQELWRQQYRKAFAGEDVLFTTEWNDSHDDTTQYWEVRLVPLTNSNSVYAIVGVAHNVSEQRDFSRKIIDLNGELSAMAVQLTKTNESLEERIAERTSILTDITEQLQKENIEHHRTKIELASSLRREKRYGDMRTKLVMMLSHQFRTPITYIKSGSELIEAFIKRGKPIDDERLRVFLDTIARGTTDMEKLMNDISRVIELQTQLQTEQPQTVTLLEIAEESLRALSLPQQYMLSSHEPLLSLHIPEHYKAFTRMNALRAVIMEFVRNAVQYSHEQGTITIEVETGDSLESNETIYSLSVHNTGSTVPSGEESAIFEYFYRAGEAHTVGANRSLGIGLGMANYAAEMMGGSVFCRRGLDNEARFVLSFPHHLPAHLYSPVSS